MNEINTTTTTEQATKRAAMVEKLTHRMTMVERNGEKRGKVQRLSKKDFPGGKDVYDAYVKTLVYASIMFSRSRKTEIEEERRELMNKARTHVNDAITIISTESGLEIRAITKSEFRAVTSDGSIARWINKWSETPGAGTREVDAKGWQSWATVVEQFVYDVINGHEIARLNINKKTAGKYAAYQNVAVGSPDAQAPATQASPVETATVV